jgi:hypothetical protein
MLDISLHFPLSCHLCGGTRHGYIGADDARAERRTGDEKRPKRDKENRAPLSARDSVTGRYEGHDAIVLCSEPGLPEAGRSDDIGGSARGRGIDLRDTLPSLDAGDGLFPPTLVAVGTIRRRGKRPGTLTQQSPC